MWLSATLVSQFIPTIVAAIAPAASKRQINNSRSPPLSFSRPLLAFFNQCHYHPSSTKFPSTIRRGSSHLMHHTSTEREVQRLVLIGGGHAHVQVIKALNVQSRPINLHVTLIDLQSSATYSGMVPGCVAKLYTLDQVQIALDALANWSGIDFVRGKVVGMSFEKIDGQKRVFVEVIDDDGVAFHKEYPFDVVSLDIGSTTRDFTTVPGAQQYSISTRPISELVRQIQILEEKLIKKLR